METFVPFGEWLPDLPDLTNPGATVAKNVIPDAMSYLSFPNLAVYTSSIGGPCQGAVVARDQAGNSYNYAGDASALYVSTQLSWSNVSRTVGGAYATALDDFWEFTQFGNQLIAVNGATGDAPQVISVGAANFAALGGSPPKAEHIATIRDFVVMGNISATASSPQMVRWSAINNAASWTPDAATMADFQDLPGDGGFIQKVVGGEYGTIFQERAIYRMTFVGSPLIFQFDKVHTGIGAYAPQSVVNYQNLIFFLSEDGFYMFDGSNVKPIGRGKVDRTFFNDLSTSYKYRIQAAIDPVRKIVAWAYPASGNSGGNPNKMLIYSWAFDRWSILVDLNIQYLFRSITGAYTLDSLDGISTNIDNILISLDSTQWSGGEHLFSAFTNSNRMGIFNGSAMPATVETSELQLNKTPDGVSCVYKIRPVVEGVGSDLTVYPSRRNLLSEQVSSGAAYASSLNSTGFVSVTRFSGRYHRFHLETTTATPFSHIRGVYVEFEQDGVR